MKKEFLSHYLYISWNNKNRDEQSYREFLSYMTVAKTMVKDEISEEFEMLGENAFIFSSAFDFENLKEKIKHKRFPYMLIDVTLSMSNNLVLTHLQKEDFKKVENFINVSKDKELLYAKSKLEDALAVEDYEKAIVFRDYINKREVSENI